MINNYTILVENKSKYTCNDNFNLLSSRQYPLSLSTENFLAQMFKFQTEWIVKILRWKNTQSLINNYSQLRVFEINFMVLIRSKAKKNDIYYVED